jgi:hypothetical protein
LINRIYIATGCKIYSVNESDDKERLFSLLSLCSFKVAAVQFFGKKDSENSFDRIDLIGYNANSELFNDTTSFIFIRNKLKEMYGKECVVSDILKYNYSIEDMLKYYNDLKIPQVFGNYKFIICAQRTSWRLFKLSYSTVTYLSDSVLDKLLEMHQPKPKGTEYKLCRVNIIDRKVNWANPIRDYKV